MTKLITMCLGVMLLTGCASLNSDNLNANNLSSDKSETQNNDVVHQEISKRDYSGLVLYESLPKICIYLGEMDSITYVKGLLLQDAYINYLSASQTVNKQTLEGYSEARKADLMADLEMNETNQSYQESMQKYCHQMQSLVNREYTKLRQSQQSSLKPIYPDYLDYVLNGGGE